VKQDPQSEQILRRSRFAVAGLRTPPRARAINLSIPSVFLLAFCTDVDGVTTSAAADFSHQKVAIFPTKACRRADFVRAEPTFVAIPAPLVFGALFALSKFCSRVARSCAIHLTPWIAVENTQPHSHRHREPAASPQAR
jgi:hypothetical protein